MAGPLSQMYRMGTQNQQANPLSMPTIGQIPGAPTRAMGAGPGTAVPTHGPAEIHDPAVAGEAELDALVNNESLDEADRLYFQRIKRDVQQVHEIAAQKQKLTTLIKSGKMIENEKVQAMQFLDQLSSKEQEISGRNKLELKKLSTGDLTGE